ncbi:MAG: mechanosensitive ion channel [Saprospiraceae bacterium]|nr:mechanosensitive ion channel [Saprospiraceae bacterium]
MGETVNKLIEKLQNIFEQLVLLLPNIALSIIVAIVGFFIVRFLQEKIRKLLFRQLENYSMSIIMSKVIAFVLTIGLLFLILGILQLDKLLTSLLATAGVLGLAVGLALQEPLTNAFSGIMLSIKKRLSIGDIVETNDFFGTVQEINLRSTTVQTPAGQIVTIPNKSVIQNPIVNYSYLGKRRIELDCGISYAENLDNVENLVYQAMQNTKHLNDDPVEFFYTEFGDSSISFRVRFWIDEVNQKNFYEARSEALRNIKGIFDKNGIVIPFPIRTLDFGIKCGQTLKEQMTALTIDQGTKGEMKTDK